MASRFFQIWSLAIIGVLGGAIDRFAMAQTNAFFKTVVQDKNGDFVLTFDGSLPDIQDKISEVDYEYDLKKEHFWVYVPKNYTGEKAFGLIAFISSQMSWSDIGGKTLLDRTLPSDWKQILEERELIYISPYNIGNDQPTSRRLGLTLVGILKIAEKYKIDKTRIYTAGFSGGARSALHLALLYPKLISGSIPIGGADYHMPIKWIYAKSLIDSVGKPYGFWPVDSRFLETAKANLRIALVIGHNDLRYGNIVDIYHSGFLKDGFHVKLIDVPDMKHELCSAEIFGQALDFVKTK